MPAEPDTTQDPREAGGSLTLRLTDDELREVFHRHTARRFGVGDPEWTELVESQRKKQGKRRLKQAVLGSITSRFTRSQEKVKSSYEDSWDGTSAIDQVSAENLDLCEWREEGAVTRAPATPAVHHLLLARALEALRPKTVLDVGSGNGMHSFLLASLFPDVAFHGAELTRAGIAEAEKIQALPSLPKEIEEFASGPVADPRAFQRIEFHQASAADLPFDDGAFDVAYTSLALEQMEEIRDVALASVARVARRYAVMVEPFRDFNTEGIRHDYVRSRDIFSARIEDLPAFGLHPVHVLSDIPCKVTLGVGLVIAEKR